MWILPDALQVCLYGLEHGIGIYSFRPPWPCLIVEVLATWAKFLELFGYSTVINCTFIFCTTNVFWLLPWHYGPIWTCKTYIPKLDYIACSFVWLSNKTHSEKQCTTYQWTNYHDTTNHDWYLPYLELLWSHMCCKLTCTKILQNFWVTLIFTLKF